MSKILRAELVELFMEEAASYIPAIRQNVAILKAERTAPNAIAELHRLFHTIKGAAAQVQLTDLSQGARFVEDFLDELIEEGRELTADRLKVLEKVTELLDNVIETPEDIAVPGDFQARVVALFSEAPPEEENPTAPAITPPVAAEDRQEYLQAIRSIIPLLQEMASCIVPGGAELDAYNRMVFNKLNRAVDVFAAAIRTAGMDGQYRLMHDFQLLLGKLHADGICSQPEVVGLIGDFFQFLNAVFTHGEPENSTTIERVKLQLQAFHALLAGSPLPVQSPAAIPADVELPEDIFAPPAPDDESMILLEQLVEIDFAEEIDLLWPDEVAEDDQAIFAGQDASAGQDLAGQDKCAVPDTAAGLDMHAAPDGAPPAEAIPAEAPATEAPADEPSPAEEQTVSEDQLLLLEIFRAECEEHLITINSSLNSLEHQVEHASAITPELREILSGMRRAVHTLKGAAAMTGVNLLAQGAHSLEDLLDWLHDEASEISPREVGILATGIDVIELLSQSPGASGTSHLNRLVATITAYMAQAGGRAAAGEAELADAVAEAADLAGEEPAEAATVPAEAAKEPAASRLPGESGFLRVRLDDLDELIGIEGELVVARGAVEKMLDEFGQTLSEFEQVKESLRRKSQELESGFEVKSLYGFNPVAPGEAAAGDFTEFDPIELDRYSQLNLIIRSLNEITVDINSIHATMSLLAGDIRGQVSKQQLTMRLMQEKLMRIRMTPMSSLSRMLFRTVRETAKKLEKKVNLIISGEDVYMDRFVWARITDPLMHILRNAVDHGIEPARRRLAANKPEIGTIRLEAEQHSRFVVLRVSDDGGGVDVAQIKAKLRREGLVANPDRLSEQELVEYLFHPSFSTRDDVSAISGRGVGLDVVRRNIQDLRGSVELLNRPGQGVTFEFHIPFTLSVNRAAIVSVAGREFAVPLQDIQQVKRYGSTELESGDGLYLRFGELLVEVTNLGYYLQLEGRNSDLPADGDGLLAIVFRKGEELRAVAIDEVTEQREIIVKNLGSHLEHVPGISGVTLTGAGELIPILNLRELVEIEGSVVKGEEAVPLQTALNEPLKVLIVDDSISVRHSVARLVESQAWRQQQAVDGVDALAKLASFVPDVIVLDIEMPRMNGYEFKSNINNNEAYRDIPVIMLTSRTSEKHQQKARELGIQHYMTKPYQEAAFIRLLENIRSGSVQ